MKFINIKILVCILFAWQSAFFAQGMESSTQKLRLWYKNPATDWQREALPIGNGRLGAMIFGGVPEEHLQLNEISLWSGGPGEIPDYNSGIREGAGEFLGQVRDLLREKKFLEAESLAQAHFTGQGEGFGANQTLGDIYINFNHGKNVENYRRELDLENALVRVQYSADGVSYTREYFSSFPDQVIAMRFWCSQPKGLSFDLRFTNSHKNEIADDLPGFLVMSGTVAANQQKFDARLGVETEDGEVSEQGGKIIVKNASAVTVLFSAATDYKLDYPTYKGPDPESQSRKYLNLAMAKPYAKIVEDHIKDYQNLFRRVVFALEGGMQYDLPTDERLVSYKNGANDLFLEKLFFQYGRYLLISSSRPGSLPAHLQGLWNNSTTPPWNCDYHTNINLQMNYWPAEVTNLSECALPLIDFTSELQEPGQKAAKAYYNAPGWVLHWATNVWGFTAPGWQVSWGLFPSAAAWLCQHVWEHYAFTMDRDFLQNTAYPLMKDAALFWLENLVELSDGSLVSSPSVSPENRFQFGEDKWAFVSPGASMDQQIIWDLFTNCIQASEILDIDKTFQTQVMAKRLRLAQPKIGRHGQLQEWLEDWDRPEDKHRHVSHLFALHPGKQISPVITPKLAKAAQKSLELRGDEGTGWSLAWKINFWARLLDGQHAHRLLRRLLTLADEKITSGVYANLFDTHPPFQIDGNFGATAGIAEMLLQSHLGEIHLLPALPDAWSNGSVSGLVARDGVVVTIEWKDHAPQSAKLATRIARQYEVRFPKAAKVKSIFTDGKEIAFKKIDANLVSFAGQEDKVYEIKFEN